MENNPKTKVLVVDDNPASRYATARVLKGAGFQVLEAGTGQDGVNLALVGVDAVVLDVNLPDIDGFEVCRRLRANDLTARLPVIHLSATFVKDIDKVNGLTAGADGYLTHPVEPPVLIATVNAFFRTRRAEEEMRRSEAKFRAIFDNALSGIALLGSGLQYLELNAAMCLLLGMPREQIIGTSARIFPTETFEQCESEFAKRVFKGGAWRGTAPLVRPDGEVRYLDWHVSNYSVPGVHLAIVTDITDRIRTEEQRQMLLASERAARTSAENANRLKDDFLATLSHELRTPLNAIVGWSQLLGRGRSDAAELAEGLDAIERNAKVQTQLISDLLDIARISAGKVRLDFQSVDPAAIINAALDMVRPAARVKEIEVRRMLSADAGPIDADPARLQQIVWNLVTNAVKFTPQGGRISVDLRRSGHQVEIAISDTGEGIAPALLPHLFERFRQGDASTTRHHGGLGLGLAIVKQLVEMHDGTVSATSAGLGKGATFMVKIPLPEKQVADIPQPPAAAIVQRLPAGEPPRAAATLKGVRVLVVEDDADGRALLQRILADAGAEVCAAGNVADALSYLGGGKLDVLISDIGMPTADGYDLIREVRSRSYTPQKLPAIALTAFARTEDKHRALQAGYQVHVAKPVDPRELTTIIAGLLGRMNEAIIA